SNQQNPNHQYTDSGSFQVILNVATANCPASDTFTVTVEPAPEAGFTVDSTAGCSPVFLAFTNTSIGAVNYFWDFGDGTTSTAVSPTHVFNNTGLNDTTYIVELIAETAFGCRDTVYDTVSVFPIPTAGFTSDAILDCSPLIVNFTDNSVGALSYQWDFGDSTGSNVPNPTHVFNNQTLFITNFNVSLVVISNNGCPDTATQQITVFPEPIFGFSTAPDSGCSPLVVTFPSVIGAVTYDWDFGDGGTASGPTPTHTFVNGTVNNAVFPVTLIATSSFGCSDTTVENVTVHPNPVAQITPSTNAGCHPLQVDFQNTSTGGLNFFWDFGDGDTTTSDSALVTHVYANTTTDTLFYTAQLIVETDRGCRDTVETDIEVYPQVIAAFDSDTIGCHPLTITFTDNSIEAAVYLWDFGDGTTSSVASPTHTFMNNTANTVVYTTKLLVTSTEGCQDSLLQNIVVYPKPTAAFILSDTVDCHAFTVDIQNTSQLNVANFWDFGDGDTSQTAAVNLSHTYDNTGAASLFHTLRLEVVSVDGCRDTLTQQMEVYPEVIASFASDTIGCHPLNISFSDSSKQAAVYQWNFGDGSPVDTNASPTHVFQNNGLTTVVYTTELIVTSSDGCADTTSQNITVFPKPTAAFAVSDTVGCQPLTVDITNNSVLNIANAWDFGDGDTSQTAAINLSHTYGNLGAAPVFRTLSLEVVSIDGCRDTAERVIEVYPQIVADFGLPASGCSPFALQLSDSSINANVYQWDFGDGTPGSGLAEPFHVFQNPLNTDTTYTVTLIVTSVEGCMDTLTQDIEIYPKPLASFNLAPDPVCHEEPVTFTNNSVNNDLNFWNFGGGLVTNNAPVFDTTFTNTSGNTVNTVIALTVETV
ncbi:MAG: PKD domain-containing protein, partial [Bacteroidota bacterium]